MKIPMVVYRNPEEKKNRSWVRYILRRVKENQNNLIVVVGKTGSGKSWTALSICEKISEENGVPFGIDNVVFGLRPLMLLINSGKLKKGSCIVFDEPQVSISAREWQSKANRVFNYLITTFRHRNLTLFFCTPYEDLLDKSTRKLFHCKFETVKINRREKTTRIKPTIMQYNSKLQKFYEAFLKICYKPRGMGKYVTSKLRKWDVPKPSKELIDEYECKKLRFTNKLNKDIEEELIEYERKKAKKKPDLKEQTEQLLERLGSIKLVAKVLGIGEPAVRKRLRGKPPIIT